MNVLSLFDGMGCGLQALKQAGIQVDKYFASEVDKYALKVAKKNHPEIIHLGDICGWESWDLPQIDLIIGGSPCQGFSFAGKQLNFEDPRSALFFKYVEILWSIQEKNPGVKFLLENVRMKKEYLDAITELLEVEPVMINSALVSAQNRVRYYWANWEIEQPEDMGIKLEEIIDGTGVIKNRGEYIIKTEKSQCLDANYHKGVDNHGQRTVVFKDKSQSILATIYKENVKSMVKRHKYGLLVRDSNEIRKLTPVECEKLQTLPENYTKGASNTQRYKMIGNGWTVAVIEHIFKCADF